MKKYIFLFILSILYSCTSSTIYKKPENLIPKDTMVMLLTDMYITSSAKYMRNKYKEINVNYTTFIYQKYKIDSSRFKTSNIYYNTKVEEYTAILNQVKDTLERRKNKYKRTNLKK